MFTQIRAFMWIFVSVLVSLAWRLWIEITQEFAYEYIEFTIQFVAWIYTMVCLALEMYKNRNV